MSRLCTAGINIVLNSTHTVGRYIFLEASRDLSGALPEHEARLLSPDLRYTPGEPEHEQAPFCFEFWYHNLQVQPVSRWTSGTSLGDGHAIAYHFRGAFC